MLGTMFAVAAGTVAAVFMRDVQAPAEAPPRSAPAA